METASNFHSEKRHRILIFILYGYEYLKKKNFIGYVWRHL